MKKLVVILLIVLSLGVIGGYLYFTSWYNNGIARVNSNSSEKVRFEISQGESSESIGQRLEEKGLISSDLLFRVYLRRSARAGELQAGEFNIAPNLTMVEVVDVLSNAVELDTVRATIIEGYKLSQINTVLTQTFSGLSGAVFDSTEFDSITKGPDSVQFSADIQAFLDANKPAGKSLEGFLYPDTYEFKNDDSTREVIEDLINQFIKKTENLNLGDNFYEKLVLASIVERESLTNEERSKIASVFQNRLDIGMALESDATVNYATGKSDPRPTYADLKIDSPYNTYKYPGLTPTPICNPRIESIQAALDPADTDYYYFIHEQDGSGQVHFARTLSEHNENVREYLD